MIISAIVATAKNGVIGKEGGLPWYLPAELAYFKEKTMGHPIIMGRKTHDSIGRALPGRQNIVITRDKGYRASEGAVVVHSLEEAFKQVKDTGEVFIIGGAAIYEQALPKLDRIYQTLVGADMDGDKFFRFDSSGWHKASGKQYKKDEKNQYDFEFITWERKK